MSDTQNIQGGMITPTVSGKSIEHCQPCGGQCQAQTDIVNTEAKVADTQHIAPLMRLSRPSTLLNSKHRETHKRLRNDNYIGIPTRDPCNIVLAELASHKSYTCQMIFTSVLVACKQYVQNKVAIQKYDIIGFYCIALLCMRYDESSAWNVLVLPFIKVPIGQN